MRDVKVKKGGVLGRTWGVYVDGKLVEGGFFGRDAAERCAEEYRRNIDGGASFERAHNIDIDY